MMRSFRIGLPSIPPSRVAVALAAALLTTLVGHAASAQSVTPTSKPAAPSVEDKAAADALFDTALKMMEQGNYNDACEKLQKSHALDPAVGTLLNLGRCYRERGQTASSWTTYREAAALARQEGQSDREKLAREEAQALEKKLVRVKLIVSEHVANLPGLSIEQNGQLVSLALAGEALPVNPGPQSFLVKADGQSKTFSVDASQEGQTYSLNIDQLENTAPSEEPLPAPADGTEPDGAAPDSQHQSQNSSYVGPILLGAAGVTGIAVGTVFAFVAQGHDNNAREICKSITAPCTQDEVNEWNDELSSAKSSATVAYIGWGVGGAALVGSAIWFLLQAPSSGSDSQEVAMTPIISPHLWGFSAKGSF